MDVCGEGRNIGRSHLIQLAQQGGIDLRWAAKRLDAMLEVVDMWPKLIESFDIRRATRQKIHQDVLHQRETLSR
jgi:serine/threonine-protein kinase HipA